MSVCDHISGTTLSSFTKFLYLSLSVVMATARSSCPAALRYAMYFRVYGWRHIYTQPGDSTEDSMYLTLWHTLKLTHKGLAPYWGQSQISMIVLRKGSSFCLPINFPPQTYLRITDWFLLGVKLTRAMWILLVYNYSKAITTTLVLGITI